MPETNGNQILDKHFFYVARHEEQISQGCSDSPEGFQEKISGAKIAWLDYWIEDLAKEAPSVAEKFGFSKRLATELLKKRSSGYEDYDSELGLKIPAVSVRGNDVTANPVLILMRKNMILTIHSGVVQRFIRFRRYAEVYLRKVPKQASQNDNVTMMLIRLIDENNESNFDHLREIEEHGDEMSKLMMDMNTPRTQLGPQIYSMKHALIVYLDSLWATLTVLNALRYGDAELITDSPRLIERIGLLSNDVTRQIELSEHMSEVLASGLEVLQSIYNNQLQILNNRMAFAMTYLTILGTAVLVPNTIATVMSNTAYNLQPQDAGWYTAVLIGSTVISTLIAYWFVKKRGWMPKTIE
jgi:magnesium transporter